jgi:hypothetical protein
MPRRFWWRCVAYPAVLAIVLTLLPGGSASSAGQLSLSPAASQQAIHAAGAGFVGNPACPGEEVSYNPGNGEDIVVPEGYKVDVFARDLNFPTGIAFLGNRNNFKALILESGRGLPGRCNDPTNPDLGQFGGLFNPHNPFTPDMLVLDNRDAQVKGPLFKPTESGGGFQPLGPAIGLAFERGARGGSLFASDSNQGARGATGPNNSSRLLQLNVASNTVTPLITGLPTGDHPTEEVIVKDGFLYWSQGSATNSGVTGHDNGAIEAGRQHDIACQDVTLSNNTWDSGDGHLTSGYSDHGVARPGARVTAFEGATAPGMCTGAILRAPIQHRNGQGESRDNVENQEQRGEDTSASDGLDAISGTPVQLGPVQPFSWGYRNPFGLRFAPDRHALAGRLFVTENGEDERGARPTNNAPDRLQVAEMNRDGTPDYHGWPDRFGYLDSTQSVFNPIGGPADDLCGPPAMPAFHEAACAAAVKDKDVPVRHVFAFPPQPPKAPLALEPADVADVQPDFAPRGFVHGAVKSGAALVPREGDFGFSPGNGEPEEGHDIRLVNFTQPGQPPQVNLERFAFNCPVAHQAHLPDGSPACKENPKDLGSPDVGGEQAFPTALRGINRPIAVLFGPDGALYLVDYGAVRDVGRSDPDTKYKNPDDAPLVQIPHTGVIWKISRK